MTHGAIELVEARRSRPSSCAASGMIATTRLLLLVTMKTCAFVTVDKEAKEQANLLAEQRQVAEFVENSSAGRPTAAGSDRADVRAGRGRAGP